jgi:hypothetical protein
MQYAMSYQLEPVNIIARDSATTTTQRFIPILPELFLSLEHVQLGMTL